MIELTRLEVLNSIFYTTKKSEVKIGIFSDSEKGGITYEILTGEIENGVEI